MIIEAATPDEYMSKTGEREPILREIDALIRETAPGLERTMVSGAAMNMIGYGMFHYKGKSGREGDWPVIALANQKNYVSLYVAAIQDGKYVAELNADRLGKVSVGRSCIRFKKLEHLNLDVVREILIEMQIRKDRGEATYEF